MEKLNLNSEKKTEEKERETVYLTFTDLFRMKQAGLEELLIAEKEVFLLSRKMAPIKLSLARVS